MKNKILAVIILCLTGFDGGRGEADELDVLSQYEVVETSDEVMREVARRFEIVERSGRRFQVVVPVARLREFEGLVPHARLVMADLREEFQPFLENTAYRAGYHDYDEVVALLKELATKRPDIAQVEIYGRSSGGRELYLLKLSDNVAADEAGEPRLMIDAATHGDELITTEVVLSLLQELVNGYGVDPRLTAMIEQTALYIVPVVNPDGFVQQSRYAEGVDPNRNYPYPEEPNRQPISIIRAIMDLVAKHRFAGSMDVHAYGGMVMYPWAYTLDEIEDAGTRVAFHTLTEAMAAENGWDHGPISKVIYEAPGSSADYYFWRFQTKAVAVELGSTKIPPSSEIPRYVDDAREMTWRFIESFFPSPVP